jgi:hypothetical protein
MKLTLTFAAESAEDLQKLQITLASFTSGLAIEAGTNPGSALATTSEAPKPGRKKKADAQAEVPAPTANKGSEFDFDDPGDDDFGAAKTSEVPEKVDLEMIRDFANEKAAAGHTQDIKRIMGSFGVARLAELKPEAFTTFYKSIAALK